jgi:hypothetical protein
MNLKVNAVTVYNGQLIAAGFFTTAGGPTRNRIATWNGAEWQALGSGMDDTVFALTVYDGELIAGGYFTQAGGVTCNKVARWNGSSWQTLGSGIEGWVHALAVHNGELIVGGWIGSAGGVQCNNIARWDGSAWHPLGSGVGRPVGVPLVASLTSYNGELVAGGAFTTAGGVTCNHIARWDGVAWYSLGAGMAEAWPYDATVGCLTTYNAELVAAGRFISAGGVPCDSIARWDGTVWRPLGSGLGSQGQDWVDTLVVHNGELIGGGRFRAAGGGRIARWDGSSWQPLASGMSGGAPSVRGLTTYNGDLIAGGDFTTAGGTPCNYIARWGTQP